MKLTTQEARSRTWFEQANSPGCVSKKVLGPDLKQEKVDNIQMEYLIYHQSIVQSCSSSKECMYLARGRCDGVLRMRMKELVALSLCYGFWRLHILLRREGFTDKHKRIYPL